MERRRDIVILYRSVYQRSSDFESRHLRLRTISLRPYKDSVSTPFSQCPQEGTSRPPPRPSSCLKTPHPQLQSPHLPTLRTRPLNHQLLSRHLVPNSYPPSPTHCYLHTLHRAHTLHTSLSYTSLSYREYTPSTSDPRTFPADSLPRALRGTQYARGSVHVCTQECTHVYSNVYTHV